MTNTPTFCDQCGTPLKSHASVCASCGAPVSTAGAETRPAAAPCPVCGRPGLSAAETIARYDAIPDKKNPTDEEAAQEDRRFEITQYLAPPEKPEEFKIMNWIIFLFIPVVNVFSVFFAPLVKSLKLFMSLVTLLFIGLIIWYAAGAFDDPFAARDKTYLAGFVWMMLYIGSLLYSKHVHKKGFALRLADYEKAMERWKHLCYCESCDKVYYDDGPGKSVPVEQTRLFLLSD